MQLKWKWKFMFHPFSNQIQIVLDFKPKCCWSVGFAILKWLSGKYNIFLTNHSNAQKKLYCQILRKGKIYVENSHEFKSAVYFDGINFCSKHEIFHQPKRKSRSIHMYENAKKEGGFILFKYHWIRNNLIIL